MCIKQSFRQWLFINDDKPGHFRRARSIVANRKQNRFHWQISFFEVRGIYSRSVYNLFLAKQTRERTAIAKSIWKNLSVGWIFIGARVTKFAHKLQTTQIGRNFSCRTSREIIAWVPCEHLPSKKNSAAKFFVQKGMFNLPGLDQSASMIYCWNFIEMDSQ